MSLALAEHCFCGGETWLPTLSYAEPPQGETPFPLPKESYRRAYYQCPACGHFHGCHEIDLGFLYDGAYVEATYGGYEGIAKTFDRIKALKPEQSDNVGRVTRIADFARRTGRTGRPLRLLDIGAGLGIFPSAIKELGWAPSAIDPDPHAARHMRERLGIEVIEADIFKIKDGTIGPFDFVTLNKVLEHVVDPVALLQRSASFLDKGGVIYFEVPDGPGALSEGAHREEFFIEHHHAFSLESARCVTRAAGLKPLTSGAIVEPSSKYTIFIFAER